MDLAHSTVDYISPDYPPGTGVIREVNNACVVIPAEIPGVIGVSANGSLLDKTFYSNYGIGVTQVVAPGGDPWFQYIDDASYGAVLSTYPKKFCNPEWGDIYDPDNPDACYSALSGTSMASPHVTGMAALIISQYGSLPPGRVQAMITQTAGPLACPPNPFDPGGWGYFLAYCQGGFGNTSFYGRGQVNALNAVLHSPTK